ncbi:MAG: T9SS type A sorting domain-containing protein [Bacteroidia bacterium]|nr:T9SS type A sorting domain-containing protein [Bacteroidia bacterium]
MKNNYDETRSPWLSIKRFTLVIAFLSISILTARATNYYTFASGDWSSASIWTTDPTGLTSVSPAVPGASDAVFIVNNKTVTNTVTARTVVSTFIQANATLDLGTLTGNNLGTVTGQGRLKIGSNTFPGGTFTGFVSASGGMVEYYDITGNLPTQLTYNHLKISNSTASGNNCVLVNGTNPTNYTINGNLILENTGSGSLQVTLGNAATNIINLNVNKSVSVSSGVRFQAGVFNAIHNLIVRQDFTNNGLVQFSNSLQWNASTNGAVNLKFDGTGNSTLSCNSATNLYTLIVNKGIDAGTTLQVNSSAVGNLEFYTDADALQLNIGTVKFGVNNTISRVNGGGMFTIPNIARLWVDGANFLLNGSASGVQVNGEYKITAGEFSIGNEGLILGFTGLISIDGGVSTVEKVRPSTGVGTHFGSFSITSGIINVDGSTAGSGSSDFPRFSIPYPNQGVYLLGGTINIANPETGTALGGGILIGCNNYTVSNGTINITIPASSTNFIVNSSIPLNNVYVYKNGAGSAKLVLDDQPIGAGISLSSPVAAKPLSINSDLVLVTGNNPEFKTNNHNVSVKRNFSINIGTTYTPQNNTTTFNGTTTQYFTLNGTITGGMYNVTIDKPLTVTCFLSGSATSLDINNNLQVLVGTFHNNGKKVNLLGNSYISGLANGLGQWTVNGTGAQTIGGNGAGRIEKLTINKSSGTTTLVASLQIEQELRLANGSLDIGLNTLTFTPVTKVYDDVTGTGTSFSNTKMINTDGVPSTGGLRKRFTSVYDEFLYPLGTANKYTPAFIKIDGLATTYGYITIRAVNNEHPVVTASNQSLKYYWKTTSTGFNLGSANVEHYYTYDETDVVTGVGVDESEYVAAYYLPNNVVWVTGDVTEVDETTNTIFIDPNVFGQVLDGEFTAGDRDPDDPFQDVIAFYSIKDGDWDDNNLATTPWSVIGHGGAPTNLTPASNNPVFVGDGISYNHTVSVSNNGAKAGNLFIGGGSTLDIGSTTGHNFSVLNGYGITGSGKLRISSSAGTAVFPAGDFGLFLSNMGGIVEYYTNGVSFTIPTVSDLPSAMVLSNYNYLNIVPEFGLTITMPDIDLTLYNNFKMLGAGRCYLNSASSKILTANLGMNFFSGATQFRNNFSQTLNVNGGFNIYAGARFEVATAGTAVVNYLNHNGSISNNGVLDFNAGSGRVCEYLSYGTGNRSLSGTNNAAYTELYKFTLNRGVSPVNEYNVDVKGNFVTPTNGWLILQNGTMKFSNGYNLTLTDQPELYTIPATAKLQVNHSSCIVNIGTADDDLADLMLIGKLQIDNGIVNIGSGGNSANNDIEYSANGLPEIEVKGSGALYVNGQIRRNLSLLNGSLVYKQTGNSSVVISGSNASPSRGKLEIANFGSVFNMSDDATLRLIRGGGTSYGDIYLHASSYNVDGGTIICQQGSLGAAQTYSIDAIAPIFNLNVNGNTGVFTATAKAINNPLTIKGTLSLDNDFSYFNANGIDVNIEGNLENNNSSAVTGINAGGYKSGTDDQVTTFSSSTNNQLITGMTGNLTNFANLKINNTAASGTVSLSVNTNIRVNTDLILTKGTLQDGGNTITSIGDIENSAQHASTGSGKIICQGPVKQYIGGNGTGKFGNLTIDNILGVSMTASQTVNNILNLNNGSLFIDAYLLRLTEDASVAGTFSGFRMIQTNGLLGDSGVVKMFNTGTANFTFPVGSDVDYMPVQYNITANTAPGSIRVAPVNSKHPATTDPLDLELFYFWVVRGTGFAGLNIDHTYNYKDIFVNGNESAYVTGRFVAPQWVPAGGIPLTVDAVANTMTLTGVNYIDGDYTCGESSEFQFIETLYSRNATLGGDWDDGNTWSVSGHAGGASGITPTYHNVIIASGHTVEVNNDGRTCSILHNDGTLDLKDKILNVFGYGEGTGLMRIKASASTNYVFPSGDFNLFTSSTGGTVEYYGTQSGNILPHLVYNNLLFTGNSTKVLSNINITVNGDLTISDGVVDNSVFNKDISIHKNWNNNVSSSAFVPGSGSVNFIGASQVIGGTSSTVFNHIKIDGSGVKSLAQPIAANGNILIDAGTFDVSSSNLGVDLKGNFTNNATFNSREGLVTLNGSTSQQILNGTTHTAFFDLTLNNPMGAKLGIIDTLKNTLTVSSGTFDFSPYRLILKSTLTRTARIAPLITGDVTGDITMERLAPGPNTGWAILGTPVKNAKINQWTDDFPTSGFVGSTGNAGGFISIWTYLEFDLAAFDSPTSYTPVTNANVDDITPGTGYWVYLGTGYVSTLDILMDVTGPTTKGFFDFGVTFSSSGSLDDDGFNMVANPYPSAIDWDSPSWTKTNVEDAIYFWQTDLHQYATYISGVGVNGASNLIPSSQGFFVKTNNLSCALQANENVKVAGNPVFIKSSGALSNGSILRMKVEGNNFKDEAVLRFAQDASVGFDGKMDAYKLYSTNTDVPSIGIVTANKDLSVNTLPNDLAEILVPLRVTVGVSGNYSLSFDGLDIFDNASCVVFEDLKTGSKTDIHNVGTYQFYMDNNTTAPRFMIHITKKPALTVSNSSCSNLADGSININNPNNIGTWNYSVKDDNGQVIANNTVANASTVNGLSAGTYYVTYTNHSNCGSIEDVVVISSDIAMNYTLTATTPVEVANGIKVDYSVNNSTEGVQYIWNFGDGVIEEGGAQMSHIYTNSGVQNVQVTIVDGTCTETLSQAVTLISDKFKDSKAPVVSKSVENFIVNFNFENTTSVNIQVVDVLGKEVIQAIEKNVSNDRISIPTTQLSNGVYFLNIRYNNQTSTTKLTK